MKFIITSVILFVLWNTVPVFACNPAFNAAYPAMLSSWVVWLTLACVSAAGDGYIRRSLIPWFLYPVCFALFIIPLPSWLVMLNCIFFISFSVSNILEFLTAFFDKKTEEKHRKRRMLLFGAPTLCLAIGGIVFRWINYTSAAGTLRVLTDKGILIYSLCLLTGVIVYAVIDGKKDTKS